MMRLFAWVMMMAVAAVLVGCSGRPTALPHPDPALRKSSAEFAADAAKRFPYPADAEQGGTAVGRAQVGYTLNVLEIVNLSSEPWTDVDVWVNRSYVVHVPKMEPNRLVRLPFQMIFNDKGQYFPLKNNKMLINRVELVQGGKVYEMPFQLAD